MESWIEKTKQTWKIILIFVVAMISIISFGVYFTSLNYGLFVEHSILGVSFKTFFLYSFASSSILFIPIFFFLVRCKNCRSYIFWSYARQKYNPHFALEALKMSECPFCDSKKN